MKIMVFPYNFSKLKKLKDRNSVGLVAEGISSHPITSYFASG